MKFIASFIKAFKENMRDWKALLLVLLFSPFFVFLIWLFYGGEATTYKVGIANLDSGQKTQELIREIETLEMDEAKLFDVMYYNNAEELTKKLKDKTIDLGLLIPADYSTKLENQLHGEDIPTVDMYGSMGNVKYTIAALFITNSIYEQGMSVQEMEFPSYITETFVEKNTNMNEFDGYVPGLISLAVLMTIFTSSASIVRENDKRTLMRLKLSPLGSFNFLSGITVVQGIIAVVALTISYWTALGLGYQAAGSFATVLVVGILSSLSMVSVSLIIGSFLNTVFDVLTIGCFPFFVMMFFSGSMFPMTKINMIEIFGHPLGITDLIPLTHTASAFNKILNFGSGLSDVLFEIVMICILTVVYFGAGIMLYQKRKLSKA